MKKTLKSSKTVWAGIGAVLTAAGCYFSGEMTMTAAVQMAFTGIIGIFLRSGMLKSE